MTRRSDDDTPTPLKSFFFFTDLHDSREWPISRWKRRISPKGDKFAPLIRKKSDLLQSAECILTNYWGQKVSKVTLSRSLTNMISYYKTAVQLQLYYIFCCWNPLKRLQGVQLKRTMTEVTENLEEPPIHKDTSDNIIQPSHLFAWGES